VSKNILDWAQDHYIAGWRKGFIAGACSTVAVFAVVGVIVSVLP
jgi:hypothetical protein